MTKLLDRAIARARALSEAEQDEAAEILLWAMGDPNRRADDGALAFNAGMERAARADWSGTGNRQVFDKR